MPRFAVAAWLTVMLFSLTGGVLPQPAQCRAADGGPKVHYESIVIEEGGPQATLHLLWCDAGLAKRPAILMLGSLKHEEPLVWAIDLLKEGYLLAAFMVDHPLDPDPKRRAQWLYFDQRVAHSYVLGGSREPADAARVIDYLVARRNVDPKKIGWMGASSTGILGLAAATSPREPRLAAIVAFVSTGAYEKWLDTWHTNGLWKGETKELWPETRELLKHDPIRHVDRMFPTAVLIVNGGDDKVVDISSARAFVDAARPFYARDPERLQLVVYEGVGHNLPRDTVKLYTEHWFRAYMHPTKPPPTPAAQAGTLEESAKRTSVNSSENKRIIRGE